MLKKTGKKNMKWIGDPGRGGGGRSVLGVIGNSIVFPNFRSISFVKISLSQQKRY